MNAINEIINVSELYFKYDSNQNYSLENINFKLNANEILVILGQSGCGKTTLFKNLLALEKPERGAIVIDGSVIDSGKKNLVNNYYRKIGVLFQSGALINSLNIFENLKLPLDEMTNLDDDLKKIIIKLKLNWVGLENIESSMPSELSGGMKKRAALARAIMLDPKILYFDEPHSGLDPLITNDINNLIFRIREAFKITLVVITHDINSALFLADKILMLNKGKPHFFGTKTEFEKLIQTDSYIKEFVTISISKLSLKNVN
ncbi:MAG TPA: ATP-binding cassette domain-containing protein [bacterium]|nr:ATP-binding cassette domain-containing protein [bacterium]HPN32457.1 ATP-binding cassette domain-containing protein [bacterium]